MIKLQTVKGVHWSPLTTYETKRLSPRSYQFSYRNHNRCNRQGGGGTRDRDGRTVTGTFKTRTVEVIDENPGTYRISTNQIIFLKKVDIIQDTILIREI